MILTSFYRVLFSFSLLVVFFVVEAQANSHPIPVFFRDEEGAAITTSLDVRISLWDTYDVREEDFDETGAINTSARHYGQYQTTLTIHPDENGYFIPSTYGYYSFRTHDLLDFPAVSPFNGFLQVEFKDAGAPDTSYRIYDFVDDPPFQHVTRLLLDENSTYYVTEAGPKTSWNTFTLDANNNAPTAVTLQFGEILGKTLSYHISNTRFEFNDDVHIEGALSVTGIVNFSAANVGIGTDSPQSALHVANGHYAQFSHHQFGPPPSEDCDSDTELGRISIDTQNNRLYVCNGASRGWDYVPLND